jgi:UDP-2,3-diacylglucosamine hydrolase
MKEPASGADGNGPLAICCAGGSLPFEVADAARRQGREVYLFALRGWADSEKVAAYPHRWGGLGQLGAFCRFAREHGCRDVVLIGTLIRPSFWAIRPDIRTILLAPKVFSAFRGGDNYLLSSLGHIIEQHGFRIVGAHVVAPEILVPEGALGSFVPSERDRTDIARGLDLLRAIGSFDVGQAVVVADNRVLAIEAADGTDHMLDYVATLRSIGRIKTQLKTGVLVKAPKPTQERRIDLPTIGPQTIAKAASAGLAGIAVAAGSTVMAEAQRVVEEADRARLFVVGVRAGEAQG